MWMSVIYPSDIDVFFVSLKEKMRKIALLIFAFMLVNSMSFGQTREEKKIKKQELNEVNFQYAKDLVDSGQFTFRSAWMNTRAGKRVQLDAGRGYLTINDGVAQSFLPYFGVVRVASMYEGGGIEFNSEMKDYEVSYDEKRRIINIEFKMKGRQEKYDVYVQIFNGLTASVTINSNVRDSIIYDGNIVPLDDN